MGEYATKLAGTLTGTEGKEQAGASVVKGVGTFVKDFSAKANDLYNALPIDNSVKSQASNFNETMTKLGNDFADNPAFDDVFGTPFMAKVREALVQEEGNLSFGTIKALRTKIGNKINSGQLLADADMGELKMLYGALSNDMEEIAFKNNAGKEFTRANEFWKAGRQRIDDTLQPLVDKAVHSDVYKAVLSGSKDGAQKLRILKRSMPEENWNAVVGQHIRELGRAKPGAQDETGGLFSASTFMTNYNALDKNAKKVLFSGEKYRGLETAMSNLAKASDAIKDTSKMANPSGTAQRMMYFQLITGGLGGAVGGAEGAMGTMAAATLAPVAVAKLVTSPKFINWLANGSKILPDGVSGHLGRLTAIAAADESMRAPIEQYMTTIMGNQK